MLCSCGQAKWELWMLQECGEIQELRGEWEKEKWVKAKALLERDANVLVYLEITTVLRSHQNSF